VVIDKLEQGIANVIRKELGLERLPSKVVTGVLRYLDSHGVVRRIDGGLPRFQERLTERANAELMVKQGWCRTRGLIEVKK